MSTSSEVPLPEGLWIVMLPPSASMRSTSPVSPEPRYRGRLRRFRHLGPRAEGGDSRLVRTPRQRMLSLPVVTRPAARRARGAHRGVPPPPGGVVNGGRKLTPSTRGQVFRRRRQALICLGRRPNQWRWLDGAACERICERNTAPLRGSRGTQRDGLDGWLAVACTFETLVSTWRCYRLAHNLEVVTAGWAPSGTGKQRQRSRAARNGPSSAGVYMRSARVAAFCSGKSESFMRPTRKLPPSPNT